MNQFGANATSGAGAGDIGVAGAVAINIVTNTSQALIETERFGRRRTAAMSR